MNPFKVVLFATLGLISFICILSSYYIVETGYRGVITRNGEAVGIASPGLGFKVPIFDSVTDMSVQTTAIRMTDVMAYSRDIQQASLVVVVNTNLLETSVLDIFTNVGVNYPSRVVYPVLQRRIKEVFGAYSAVDIIGYRDKIATEILDKVKQDLSYYGIQVSAVQIENIDFSDAYEAAAEAAAKAEADVKRKRQELEQSKIESEKIVVEAAAQARAKREQADANAYSVRETGEAEADAIKARAAALAENSNLVNLITAEKWDGKLPVTMVPEGAVPFVTVK